MTNTPPELLIRSEQPEHAAAIFELTQLAFADLPFADGDEGAVIERLRDSQMAASPGLLLVLPLCCRRCSDGTSARR